LPGSLEFLRQALEHRGEQRVLAAEVLADRTGRHLRPCRDLLHRGVAQPERADAVERGVRQLPFAHLARLRAAFRAAIGWRPDKSAHGPIQK
jgi:hypothetical protein